MSEKIVTFPFERTVQGRDRQQKLRSVAQDMLMKVLLVDRRNIPQEKVEHFKSTFDTMDLETLMVWINAKCVQDSTPFEKRTSPDQFEIIIACTEFLKRIETKK